MWEVFSPRFDEQIVQKRRPALHWTKHQPNTKYLRFIRSHLQQLYAHLKIYPAATTNNLQTAKLRLSAFIKHLTIPAILLCLLPMKSRIWKVLNLSHRAQNKITQRSSEISVKKNSLNHLNKFKEKCHGILR